MERRRHRNTELLEGKTRGMPGPESVLTKQQRIAEIARQAPEMAFTSLSHHIDMDWLREAYRRTRKDGAAGIDGQTAKDYEANLEENLRSLLDRAKSGERYKAPPVRRVYIPKGDGGTRPLRIRCCKERWSWYWNPSTRRVFMSARTGFVPGSRRTRH